MSATVTPTPQPVPQFGMVAAHTPFVAEGGTLDTISYRFLTNLYRATGLLQAQATSQANTLTAQGTGLTQAQLDIVNSNLTITELQAEIVTLQGQVASLQAEINTIDGQIADINTRLAAHGI